MSKLKKDKRSSAMISVRCFLCSIGIGKTRYGNEQVTHFYKKPCVYIYKDKTYILDEDCYELVKRTPNILIEGYVE